MSLKNGFYEHCLEILYVCVCVCVCVYVYVCVCVV